MHRLVVNPGTPQAWEIRLRPGTNRVGRADHNDFQIPDLSVSGTHCQIHVAEDSVVIVDLGSTNGTYLDRTRIGAAKLNSGQIIRLGGVEAVYYADGQGPGKAAAATPPPIPIPAVPTAPPPLAPPLSGSGDTTPDTGRRFCKFHPAAPARYFCRKCNRAFCEACVATRHAGGTVRMECRSCGVECVPL